MSDVAGHRMTWIERTAPVYEMTISSDNDASSGVYNTLRAARDAAYEAAEVDGLTASFDGRLTGSIRDRDGCEWFKVHIEYVSA